MDATAAQIADFTDLELELNNETEPKSRKSKKSAATAARTSLTPRPARRHEARAVHQTRRPASIFRGTNRALAAGDNCCELR